MLASARAVARGASAKWRRVQSAVLRSGGEESRESAHSDTDDTSASCTADSARSSTTPEAQATETSNGGRDPRAFAATEALLASAGASPLLFSAVASLCGGTQHHLSVLCISTRDILTLTTGTPTLQASVAYLSPALREALSGSSLSGSKSFLDSVSVRSDDERSLSKRSPTLLTILWDPVPTTLQKAKEQYLRQLEAACTECGFALYMAIVATGNGSRQQWRLPGLCITALNVIMQDGRICPGLLVEHAAAPAPHLAAAPTPLAAIEPRLTSPHSPPVLASTREPSFNPQPVAVAAPLASAPPAPSAQTQVDLELTSMMLSAPDCMVTLCDLEGNVIKQNRASIRYAGPRAKAGHSAALLASPGRSSNASGSSGKSYLRQLLQLEPARVLEEVMGEVAAGRQWQAVVQVPGTLVGPAGMGCGGGSGDVGKLLGPCDKPRCNLLAWPAATSPEASAVSSYQAAVPIPAALRAAASSGMLTTMDCPDAPLPPSKRQSMEIAPLPAALVSQPAGGALPIRRSLSLTNSSVPDLVRSKLASPRAAAGATSSTIAEDSEDEQNGAVAHDSLDFMQTAGSVAFHTGGSGSVSRSRLGSLMDHLRRTSSPQSPMMTPPHSLAAPTPAHLLSVEDGAAEQEGTSVTGATMPHFAAWHSNATAAAAAPAHPVTAPRKHFHEVKVLPMCTRGMLVLVVVQVDITERLEAVYTMEQVSEACVQLLDGIFPRHIVERLVAHNARTHGAPPAPPPPGPTCAVASTPAPTMFNQLASSHRCVTLLFCDIVGFTSMGKQVEPQQVMQYLNDLYSRYDWLATLHSLYKVETVGDCYVCAGGLMVQDEDGKWVVVKDEGMEEEEMEEGAAEAKHAQHALAVFSFAKAVLHMASSLPMPNGEPTRLRVGIHSGPVSSGVVGHHMPKFCLFGNAMNMTSRMETTAVPGSIHLSEATYHLLRSAGQHEQLECTGGVDVKGQGNVITYRWHKDKWQPARASGNAAQTVTGREPDQQPSLLTCAISSNLLGLLAGSSISQAAQHEAAIQGFQCQATTPQSRGLRADTKDRERPGDGGRAPELRQEFLLASSAMLSTHSFLHALESATSVPVLFADRLQGRVLSHEPRKWHSQEALGPLWLAAQNH